MSGLGVSALPGRQEVQGGPGSGVRGGGESEGEKPSGEKQSV